MNAHFANTTRRLGRKAFVDTLWVLFILSSFLVRAVEASNPHGVVDLEDNEFAEFEEFDETPTTEEEHLVGSDRRSAHQHQDGGGSNLGSNVDPGFEEDDSADGVVEDEPEEDEFSHLQDDEEFENYDRVKPGGGKGAEPGAAGAGPAPLKFTDVPAHLRSNWSNYQVELLMLFAIGIYLLNYVYGKTKNQSLAQAWLDSHRHILQQQFAVVGDDGTSQETSEGVLMRESDSTFSLWCSGRSGCQGLLVQIKLLKRQDLISIISHIMRPKYDRVVLRVELETGEMDTFVFALGQKKSLNKLGKDMTDLSQYCTEKKSGSSGGLPAGFTVLSEIAEATQAMLDNKATGIISKFEECVDFIHISDQFSGPRPQEGDTQSKLPETTKVLMLSINIPGKLAASERHVEYPKPLLSLAFYYLEKLRRFRLSREGKAKADKNRQAAQESFLKMTHQQRQEAAQQRREDKIRERKDRLMNEEDPDKQRRLEKQEMKREAKKKAPKMKQLKIKAM